MVSKSRTAVAPFAALVAACIPLIGCSSESRVPSETLATWTLVETLRIGSLDGGEYPLQSVTDLLPGPDGSILVSQTSATEVPEFGADGRLRRVFGRSGPGPGEFVLVTNLGWVGDTLWISDFGNQKISYFAADGRHLGDHRVERQFLPERPYLYPWPPRLLAGDQAIMMPGYQAILLPGDQDTASEDFILPVFTSDRAGTIVDTLSFWPLDHWSTWIERGGRITSVARPVPLPRSVGLSPGGRFLGIFTPVEATTTPAADSTRGRLTVWNAQLDTVLTRDYSAPARRVPRELVVTRSTTTAERLVDTEQERNRIVRELLDVSPDGMTYPLADDIVVADSGEIWLRLGDPGEGDRDWWVLDPQGDIRGSVTVPDGVTLKAIAPRGVWGYYLDEFDVPYVIRYELVLS